MASSRQPTPKAQELLGRVSKELSSKKQAFDHNSNAAALQLHALQQ